MVDSAVVDMAPLDVIEAASLSQRHQVLPGHFPEVRAYRFGQSGANRRMEHFHAGHAMLLPLASVESPTRASLVG